MLVEIEGTGGAEGSHRRWFADRELELIVWNAHDGGIRGFQICYDRQRDERALTWLDGEFRHERVDSGESEPHANRTPILVPDGVVNLPALIAAFDARSQTLDTTIRGFVLARLASYRD